LSRRMSEKRIATDSPWRIRVCQANAEKLRKSVLSRLDD
jgi:hypothetical protein